MITITSPQKLQQRCLTFARQEKTISLVPTMGYFHAGHESLIRKGRELADVLVVTVFVNPTQFGPSEDMAAYPHKLKEDAAIAARYGADIFFAPEAAAMYHDNHATWVEVPSLAGALCGKSRPTHFRGVCTVVNKLLMLTQPHYAVFGQKDWQQLAILRRMARDLFIPVELVGMPTVRESDGLALSSRNTYLTTEERAVAPHFQKGLALARNLAEEGIADAGELARTVRQYWRENLPMGHEDYLSFVNPDSLEPVAEVRQSTLVAAALHLGKARLIDNLLITVE